MKIALALLVFGMFAMFAASARADVKVEVVEYKHGDTALKGYLAYNPEIKGKRPGILVIHEWWGVNDYAQSRAKQLAEMGYIAFACDMYGGGATTTDPKQAGEMAGKVRKDTKVWRERAAAGLRVLTDNPNVDATKLGAIGYCFGGTTALQMACAGQDLKAVVSFHGSLFTPTAEEAKAIKGKVLVCNGAADTFITAEDRDGFVKALEGARVDYVFVDYAGAVHAFTNPDAGKAGMKGVAYDEKADKRSWAHMKQMFDEALGATAHAVRPIAPGKTPAPLADAQIAKLDASSAMKEWVNRRTFPAKNPDLDEATKSRLEDEVAKLRGQMDKLKSGAR